MEHDFYDEGYDGYLNNQDWNDCPYEEGSQEYDDWNSGYSQAEQDEEYNNTYPDWIDGDF